MLLIEVGNIRSQIVGSSYPYKEMEKKCSYFREGAQFSKAFCKGRWDGTIKLFRKGRFPTGLLSIVAGILKEHNIQFCLDFKVQFPEPKYNWELISVTPYQDQIEAIQAAKKYRRGVLKLPTGSGKTAVVACGIISEFGVDSLFVANQNILIQQAKREFEKNISNCGTIGVIADGEVSIQSITIASIQSLWSRRKDENVYKYLDNVGLIIVDEVQAVGTKMWKEIMNSCNAPYRFGLSATPTRVDNADLEIFACTGPVCYESKASDMIEADRLSDVKIEFVPYDHGLYNISMRYPELYETQIVDNEERNSLIVHETLKLLNEGRDILVLVQRIKHGETLKQMLIENNVQDVEFVFGNITGKLRERLIQDYKDGKFRVLIGSTIFDVGADLPRVSGLVLTGAGQSKIRALQRIGRAIRKWKDKKCALVIDIGDYNISYFEKQAKNRKAQYINEFGESRVITREVHNSSQAKKLKGAHWTVKKMFELF